MEDSRGILRGECKRCKCSGYTLQVETIKCECGHPPGVHVNLKSSTPSHSLSNTTDEELSGISLFDTGSSVDPDSPSGDSNYSDQEDMQGRAELMPSSSSGPSLSLFRAPARSPVIGRGRGRGRRGGVRLSRGSPQPITRQYPPEVPLQSESFTRAPEVSATQELAKGMTGSLQLSDLDGTGFEEARLNDDDDERDSGNPAFGWGKQLQGWFSSAGEQEIPQDLLCIGCGKKQKRQREDGSYYDYCGRTCSNYHRRSSPVLLPGQPKCRRCGRPCTHKRKDGSYHDYCGMTCRGAHQQETLQTSVPRIGIDGITSASVSICQQDTVRCITLFQQKWATAKGPCPTVEHVFTITNTTLQSRFNLYRQGKGVSMEEHFHGTSITCNLAVTQSLCSDAKCSICSISKFGFDLKLIGTNVSFQRFGHGFYLAPNSSKCHDYTRGCQLSGHRALLLCEVCPGRKHTLYKDNTALKAPPSGCDCIYGDVGQDLNYPEIVLYNSHSILPKCILLYKLNGTHRLV